MFTYSHPLMGGKLWLTCSMLKLMFGKYGRSCLGVHYNQFNFTRGGLAGYILRYQLL